MNNTYTEFDENFSNLTLTHRMIVTASTVALLIFLGIYHRLDIKLFLVDNSVDDWRIAMSKAANPRAASLARLRR
jgi:hypothetical protein